MKHKYGRIMTAMIVGAICFPLGVGIGGYGGMYYARYQQRAKHEQKQQRMENLMDKADAATKKSDMKEAISLYRQLLMMEPTRPDIFVEAEHKLNVGKRIQKRIEESSKTHWGSSDSDSDGSEATDETQH